MGVICAVIGQTNKFKYCVIVGQLLNFWKIMVSSIITIKYSRVLYKIVLGRGKNHLCKAICSYQFMFHRNVCWILTVSSAGFFVLGALSLKLAETHLLWNQWGPEGSGKIHVWVPIIYVVSQARPNSKVGKGLDTAFISASSWPSVCCSPIK